MNVYEPGVVYVVCPVTGVVMLLLAELAALVPALFVAVTVNVYEVFCVRPDTVIVPEPACDSVPVIPPGEEVAV